jgi:hypothetical protein
MQTSIDVEATIKQDCKDGIKLEGDVAIQGLAANNEPVGIF